MAGCSFASHSASRSGSGAPPRTGSNIRHRGFCSANVQCTSRRQSVWHAHNSGCEPMFGIGLWLRVGVWVSLLFERK
eukprot:scaffold14485_cov67-Phaeocystis_antarctica.AAC.4